MEECKIEIGDLIVRLRKGVKLSQERLALEAGVDRRYLSDIENNRRNPSLGIISKLASYFHLSLSQFFSLAETPIRTLDEIKEILCDAGYEESVVFENPDFATAFVGVSNHGQAVYSYSLMVASLIEEGMEQEEAMEFIDYNTVRALPYMGENAPIVLY